ncbi:unnamed protein product [Blepharisma stoltei]|uniref:Uncharacterized protein n=1 Tax=Blepharisma stoltei TaxID=1481888 RepID=A0AAU9IPR0_9CILI|nr:unnamed protein product [Blepharisma stoltei]
MNSRIFRFFSQLKFPPTYPEDLSAFKRMVYYRCTRAGIKEVEYILKEWADLNLEQMNREQLIQFQDEVLNTETPELLKILMGQSEHQDKFYLVNLRNYVESKLNSQSNP